jgi:hypothetical protein
MIQACVFCGVAINRRDDLYRVHSQYTKWHPYIEAEPGEYYACPKCFDKRDAAIQKRFKRYAEKHRQGPPQPILTVPIKLKVTATSGKPIKHIDDWAPKPVKAARSG